MMNFTSNHVFTRFKTARHVCLSTWLILVFSPGCIAASYSVSSAAMLKQRLQTVAAGDTILLEPGEYLGQFEIHQPITLTGKKGAVIDAEGKDSALSVFSADVTISKLQIQNWGSDLYELNAGILIKEQAQRIRIESSHLQGDGFGIYAENTSHITVANNLISGNSRLYKLDRGDGVYLKGVDVSIIHDNQISDVRDGIYLETSTNSLVFDNRFHSQQYGIHYMYTKHDEAYGNQVDNVDGGYALMSSEFINLHHNQVSNAVDFGVLLNISKHSIISNNRVSLAHNPQGTAEQGNEGKGIFIYGARDNEIIHNLFSSSDIGIYMAMGGEKNKVYGNQFVNNKTQVKYVGDVLLEWSHQGRGNYWSGYMGWDHDHDGIADKAYRPNDSLDKLFWLYPEARFLMNSPVIMLLRWVQGQFDIGPPTGIVDSFPVLSINDENHANKVLM
ncbi:nitrous oxide reductase family maturation protein NosD [Shewanella sp. D64]|uniref:nitrous oxide reductase family maturation protein NosD n=1 Tax=unclassified Shewanella TaxID=196818 RepID=UPI0022BA69A5|nr:MULTISPECIES: nitrous oxide reductase family maturation protein NosD [unclassified Shewanella]MEC4728014.1 nitrous oxide reductase family maturation protein NosD [Shewanella sp. D64]MEC4740141.1 nitrous oxide reductase family maturation protein NosD [Shewanella sp. E94]WBJ95201.1 nitrous oxide reductase family maturation protein NosD [Shewanella sp. MTB7]